MHLSPFHGNPYETDRRYKSLVDTPPGLTVIYNRQPRTGVVRAELLLHSGSPKRGPSVWALYGA